MAGQFGCDIVFDQQRFWQEKIWQMNRSAKSLVIVTTNLDGFSLANHCMMIHQICQTFPQYSTLLRTT